MGAFPGSLSEGVSSDGSSGPMVYPPPIIDSEIYERLRSSKYTPSVSHSLDSSLREGVRTIQRTARKSQGCGRFSSPLRNSECFTFYHSTDDTPSVSHSIDSSLREGAGRGCTTHRTARKPKSFGRFSSPLRKLKAVLCYYNSADSRGGNLRNKCFTTCLICTGGCVRLVRCLPFGPAGGLRYCRRLQWQTVDCPLRRISLNQSLQVLRC